jgi:DNA-binding MarR family transcriptional regulator
MRPEKLKNHVEEIVDEGQKPSASRLAESLDWHESDVHRCLNILERKGEIETYSEEAFNGKIRFVSVKR